MGKNRRKRVEILVLLVGLVWGFIEATLFFIVPDIFFTFLVLFDPILAYESSLFALIGALIGGGLMYRWGRKDFAAAARTLQALPGISHQLVDREKNNLRQKGIRAILLGPLKGVPYKIYAICAFSSGIPLARFLFISLPARSVRFILSILITELVFHHLLQENLTLIAQVSLLSGFWLIFYMGYFLKMRNLSR